MRVGLLTARVVRWAALLWMSIVLLVPAPAGADTTAAKTVVVYAEGNDKEEARAALFTAVPKGVSVADPAAYKKALINSQHYGDMGARLWTPSTRRAMLTRVRAANKRVGASVAVLARGRIHNGARDVWVLVVDESGVLLEKAVPYEGGKPNAEALRAAVAPVLATLAPGSSPPAAAAAAVVPATAAPAAASAAPAPAAPPSAAAEPEPAAAPIVGTSPALPTSTAPRKDTATPPAEPGPTKPRALAHRRFLVGARAELAGRSFGYSGAETRNLRPYDALAIPMPIGTIEFYPLVLGRVGVGLVGSFARTPPFESEVDEGRTVTSYWMRIAGGLRAGVRATPAFEIGLGARFEWLESGFDEAGRFDDQLPTTTYRAIRPGLDARVTLGMFGFGIDAGYMVVLSTGPLGDRFRGARAQGVGGDAYLALSPVRWLEFRLGARYEGFFYDLEAEPGDDFVATAAYDQSFGAFLGPYFTF